MMALMKQVVVSVLESIIVSGEGIVCLFHLHHI